MSTATVPLTGAARAGAPPSPFRAAFTTELLRVRRGFVARATVAAPVVLSVPLILGSLTVQASSAGLWSDARGVVMEFWGALLPMLAALIAALSVRQDERGWSTLLTYPLPRGTWFTAKYAAVMALLAVASTVLFAVLVLTAGVSHRLSGSLPELVAAAYLPLLAGAAFSAAVLLVAFVWGLGPTIALGVLGLLGAALLGDKDIWWAFPPAYPMRAIVPTVGIQANGIALPAGSDLADTGVVWLVLGSSLVLAALLTLVGRFALNHKEV